MRRARWDPLRRTATLILAASVLVPPLGGIATAAAAPQRRRPPPPAAASPSSLRGVDALNRVYDFILDARFDQVEAELRRACGPAPPEACDVLAATALWWRIQIDPHATALDPEFTAAVEQAIDSTTAWTEREPESAEAWFYLGGAFGARVQWRVLRGEKLAAARDGKEIKSALERAIALDPDLADAHFGIGLYKYYAAVAPAAARVLRFLLLLPGGDRDEGLAEMRRARDLGRLLQGEADYQLHIIDLWYEKQPERALGLLRALQREYPDNPLFLSAIAEIQDTYLHDVTASLDTWRSLLAAARDNRINLPSLAEAQSRLEIARLLDDLHQTDLAIETLQAAIARQPVAPYSALALAWLRLGKAHDRLGARGAAVDAYGQAVAQTPPGDPYEVRRQAAEHQRRAPEPRLANAYRLGLEGWRLFERDQLAAAAARLEQSLELNARDPVVHYRYGRVLQASRRESLALTHFELAVRDARSCPPPILANVYLEAGRLHERAGDRGQAIAAYRQAASLFGAAAETRTVASRAVDRLAR